MKKKHANTDAEIYWQSLSFFVNLFKVHGHPESFHFQ